MIDPVHGCLLRRNVLALPEGNVVLDIPSPISDESAEFVIEWLRLVMRPLERQVSKSDAGGPAEGTK